MTASVLKFHRKGSSGRKEGAVQRPLYRHHDYCTECLGHHVLELTAAMANYLRKIAPQTEGWWADQPPELIEGCHPLPPEVIRHNTLILTGESLVNLGESVETAFHALMACADRLRDSHAAEVEVRRDAAQAGEAMRLLFQYHLDEIDRFYRDLDSDGPAGH